MMQVSLTEFHFGEHLECIFALLVSLLSQPFKISSSYFDESYLLLSMLFA